MHSAKLWDEFAPEMQSLAVRLGEDERTVRFGMRKFAARGKQFTLNDRRCFSAGHWSARVFR